jgi:hypothetical protein
VSFRCPQPDPLASFSHLVFQVKFIILEVVTFVGFLCWIADKLGHDLWPNSTRREVKRLPLPRHNRPAMSRKRGVRSVPKRKKDAP